MKRKLSLSIRNFTLMAALFFGTSVFATVINVPGDYSDLTTAIEIVKADAGISEVTFNIAEGDYLVSPITLGFGRPIALTIQGAGAGKTILRGFADEEMITPTTPNTVPGRRFLNANTASNNGLDLLVKDITIKNWGSGLAGGGSGWVFLFNNSTAGISIKANFTNVNFENIVASSSALFAVNHQAANQLSMENCSVINCQSFDNGTAAATSVDSFIFMNAGTFTMKNCLFMNNMTSQMDPVTGVDKERRRGGILGFGAGKSPVVLLEDNIFVNNLYTAGEQDFVHPQIYILTDATLFVTLHMKNNVMIGNMNAGKAYDTDIYLDGLSTNVMFVDCENNIVNRVLEKITNEDLTLTFNKADLQGFDVDETYTYTDPKLDFTMEGDLPQIFVGEDGVKYVEYLGNRTGINNVKSLELNAYPNPSNGNFKIDLPESLSNSEYEVFNVLGQKIQTGRFNFMQASVDLKNSPAGLYILRAQAGSQNYSVRLQVK